MEFLNKIILRGIVQNVLVATVADKRCVTLSVLTQQTHKGNDGSIVVEHQWFLCRAWEGQGICSEDIGKIKRTDWVELTGRVKTISYTRADSTSGYNWEVSVQNTTLLDKEENSR